MALDLVGNFSLVSPPIVTPPPGGTDAGPITILPDRSTLQCAPDSVRFSVDLSQANFDASGPNAGEYYNPQYHDLVYLWNLGEDRNWLHPEKILSEWRSNQRATGPWVSHVYAQPGTYTANLIVHEPSSGKFAQAPGLPITVLDADDVYPTTQTICVNPVGDNDFSLAPQDAQLVNLDTLTSNSSIWTSTRDGTTPIRWLIKTGGQYTVGLDIEDNENPHMLFGSYGGGTAPVITPHTDGTAFDRAFSITPRYLGVGGSVISDMRVTGLNFQGNFDPRTESPENAVGKTSNVLRTDKYLDLVVDGCEMRGMKNSTLGIYFDTNAPVPQPAHFHLHNCLATDLGGQYPIFCGPAINADSSVSITGTRLAQNVDAADWEAEVRAPIRLNHAARTHVRCIDVFAYDRLNAGIKLVNTPQFDGLLVNMENFSVEGSLHPLQIQGNKTQGIGRTSEHNVLIRNGIIVGGYRSQDIVESFATGLTIENVQGIMPAGPRSAPFSYGFIQKIENDGGASTLPQHVLDAPISVRGCTWIMGRSISDNNTTPTGFEVDGAFNGFTQTDNLLLGPWVEAPTQPDPATDIRLDQAELWVARTKGLKDKNTLILDASFEIGSLSRFVPLLGTTAVVAATGERKPYHDITGAVRPAGTNVGAWHVGA